MLDLSSYNTITDALNDACHHFKNNIALIEIDRDCEKKRLTYAEFKQHSLKVCGLLQQFGHLQHARIAIIMQNQSNWLISAFAIFQLGAILIPIDYKLSAIEQAALLAHCAPTILITEQPVWEALHPLVPKTLQVIVTDAKSSSSLHGAKNFEDARIAVHDVNAISLRQKKSDIACIVYSSGTGGAAKACMLSHENYLSQAAALGKLFPIASSARSFSILPTNHAIDFMCGFLLPLFYGAAIVHQRTLRPQYLLSTMKRYRITHMALVPVLLKTIAQGVRDSIAAKPKWKQRLIQFLIKTNQFLTKRKPSHFISKLLLYPIHEKFGGNLRLLFAGGGFVDEATAAFFYHIGIPAVIGYGLTEACTVITVNQLDSLRFDTVGKTVPDVQVELRNQDHEGAGEIWVKGPTVMSAYYEAPELTASILNDGWLRTGDIGIREADGHLKLIGRTKNMIVTAGGKNVYPEDIENVFESLEDCHEFAIFAKNFVLQKHNLTNEKLLLVLRLTQSFDKDNVIAEVKKRNQRLADYKRVSEFLIWKDEFPRTASLKLKRDKLAELINAKFPAIELFSLNEL